MFASMDISTSALVAQRINLDTIAGNIANLHSIKDADGNANPYRRRIPMFASGDPSRGRNAPGVHVAEIVESKVPFRQEFEPDHPLAIEMRSVPLFSGKLNTLEELEFLHRQSCELAGILTGWHGDMTRPDMLAFDTSRQQAVLVQRG